MKILSVQQFRELASQGRCGNTPRIWLSLDDYLQDRDRAAWVFITSQRWDSFRIYHASYQTVRLLKREAESNAGLVTHPTRGLTAWYADLFTLEVPDPARQASYFAFQGEWWPAERTLTYSISPNPWGQEKRSGRAKTLTGLMALLTIKHYLGELYHRIEELADACPSAIIEMTCFGWPLGICGEHLLIWEVRDY